MGYPMNYTRVIGRNNLGGDYRNAVEGQADLMGLVCGDLRRLERDQRDDDHLAAYARRAGITPAQVKQVLDDFFNDIDVLWLPAPSDPAALPEGVPNGWVITAEAGNAEYITFDGKRWRYLPQKSEGS